MELFETQLMCLDSSSHVQCALSQPEHGGWDRCPTRNPHLHASGWWTWPGSPAEINAERSISAFPHLERLRSVGHGWSAGKTPARPGKSARVVRSGEIWGGWTLKTGRNERPCRCVPVDTPRVKGRYDPRGRRRNTRGAGDICWSARLRLEHVAGLVSAQVPSGSVG